MRTWAEIDLDAVRFNFRSVKSKTNAKIMAIIKADAYGHGVKEVARVLLEEGAYAFGVATADEAIELRNMGFDIPILILGVIFEEDYHRIIQNDIALSVTSFVQAKAINQFAESMCHKARIHIKLDTGMGRIGMVCGDDDSVIADEISKIAKLPFLEIEGMFSHMSKADETDKAYANMQFDRFKNVCRFLEEKGINIPLKHIANSASIATLPHTHMDMVRMGIVTYGLNPSDEVNENHISLKPVMTLKSRITQIKTVCHDSKISYGGHYTAKTGSKIATIAIGYADGFSRTLSGKAKVLINGHFADIVGNICMDQCMADVSHIDNINIGDEVIIFGSDGNNTITVDSVAKLMGTINYEIVCSVARRVPRAYIDNGNTICTLNRLC